METKEDDYWARDGEPQGPKKRRLDDDVPDGTVNYIIIHEIDCSGKTRGHSNHPETTRFFDPPRLYAGDCKASPLHGLDLVGIEDLEDYLEDHPDVAFIICRRYSCEAYHKTVSDIFVALHVPYLDQQTQNQLRLCFYILQENGPLAVPETESMSAVSKSLIDAMLDLEKHSPKTFEGWNSDQNRNAPYVHFYHSRDAIESVGRNILRNQSQKYTRALLNYLQSSFQHDYGEADRLFERGLVTRKHLLKVFRRNNVLISFQNSQPRGFLTKSCEVTDDGVRVRCSTLVFDGRFKRINDTINVVWPGRPGETLQICELNAYPLQYEKSGIKTALLARGTTFWSCRGRKFVSYTAPPRAFEIQITNPRYMIDMNTYNDLHEENAELNNDGEFELNEDQMNADAPPSDEFTLQLPERVRGFGLHDKKWRELLVKHIEDIKWNKAAFDRLVMDPDKKSLITAMIKEHVMTSTSADIIEGKGNGLIILLHGSPGTGKTLTAESVAELAERPLYPVTCGDVGTEPEAAEKYLESVLYIGKIWNAVVLFDESDVFLEERSQADLRRNALVSIFLRTLEYYDGILILTSNRVGTFDEAFKSRVHLALHYPAIDEAGRREIWNDFIQDLQKREADCKFDQLRAKIDLLAHEKLNGRQIRNCIRTATQVASNRKEPLSYDHLRQVTKVAIEFEQYVVETHGGNTHEDFARRHNIRSS